MERQVYEQEVLGKARKSLQELEKQLKSTVPSRHLHLDSMSTEPGPRGVNVSIQTPREPQPHQQPSASPLLPPAQQQQMAPAPITVVVEHRSAPPAAAAHPQAQEPPQRPQAELPPFQPAKPDFLTDQVERLQATLGMYQRKYGILSMEDEDVTIGDAKSQPKPWLHNEEILNPLLAHYDANFTALHAQARVYDEHMKELERQVKEMAIENQHLHRALQTRVAESGIRAPESDLHYGLADLENIEQQLDLAEAELRATSEAHALALERIAVLEKDGAETSSALEAMAEMEKLGAALASEVKALKEAEKRQTIAGLTAQQEGHRRAEGLQDEIKVLQARVQALTGELATWQEKAGKGRLEVDASASKHHEAQRALVSAQDECKRLQEQNADLIKQTTQQTQQLQEIVRQRSTIIHEEIQSSQKSSSKRIRDLEAEIEELTKAKAISDMQRERMERSLRTVQAELEDERTAHKAHMKNWEDVANGLRDQLVKVSIAAGRREVDKNAATSLLMEAKAEKENTELDMKLRGDAVQRQQTLQQRLALDST